MQTTTSILCRCGTNNSLNSEYPQWSLRAVPQNHLHLNLKRLLPSLDNVGTRGVEVIGPTRSERIGSSFKRNR